MSYIKTLLLTSVLLPLISFTAFQPQTMEVNKQAVVLRKDAPEVGKKAPDIELTDINGKTIKLSSLKGKVVLIDFWASWCGPCRKENPYTVEIYNAYKDKGFTVFSVSIDQSKDKWIKAVEKDELVWPYHVIDPKGWYGKAATTYKVEAIPATFLVDKDGTIVATDLRGAELDKTLKKMFKEKA
ncbi:TlpA family protein disulfide reductase [Rhodocytophaga rosea]|uniref:TlpA family protein disulfide reductase n=1 Tax=Rhodocytophaga rosea TaxID=2704465 RepID=A0A6C0GF10_9BACT|nr:TlpA disulfide reductase family protein [Rhodocytophaga rosea]QHT66591.1 TlpA family protein disulfide reductase [Rhodocytophaga rosea]